MNTFLVKIKKNEKLTATAIMPTFEEAHCFILDFIQTRIKSENLYINVEHMLEARCKSDNLFLAYGFNENDNFIFLVDTIKKKNQKGHDCPVFQLRRQE